MTSPIALILGSAASVGKSVASALESHGYRVAVGSRNPDPEDAKKNGLFPVIVDVTKPQSISEAFATVNSELML